MSTLHTVNKPSWSSDTLQSCLRLILSGDTLLLIEDGTYNVRTLDALAASLNVPLQGLQIRVLRDDLVARGLSESELAPPIIAIDYAEFVALVCQHQQSVHWF